jgi:hypothetical protein
MDFPEGPFRFGFPTNGLPGKTLDEAGWLYKTAGFFRAHRAAFFQKQQHEGDPQQHPTCHG